MIRTHRKISVAFSLILILSLIATALVTVSIGPSLSRAQSGTTVEVGSSSLDVGGSDSVDIWIRDFPQDGFGLGAYTIRIDHDPAMIDITGISPGDSPFNEPIIAYYTEYLLITQFSTAMPGPMGDIRIADIEFTCLAPGVTYLELTIQTLANTNGDEIPATPVNGTIIQDGDTCGDVNCDGNVNMADVTILWYDIAEYPTPGEWVICDEWDSDVNCDGYINMADVTILWYDIAEYPTPGVWMINCCAP